MSLVCEDELFSYLLENIHSNQVKTLFLKGYRFFYCIMFSHYDNDNYFFFHPCIKLALLSITFYYIWKPLLALYQL